MLREVFALADEALCSILSEDVASAMNRVNGKKIGAADSGNER
jgi:hypothetical protein